MESSKIITSCFFSTSLLALAITISATCTCREGGSSKVLATTSPLTDLFISVTSSGLSSTSKTINLLSGLFFSIECAIDCIKRVFPAFGGETISPL